MSGRTIVVTGASDGIGAAAVRQLAARGERVVLVGRSQAKTAAVADPLGAPYHLADFADLSQVRALADELAATYPRIDVLANNAGGLFGARSTTVNGFETTFQVNHLAPFLLTTSLLPTLLSSGAAVIATSSVAAARFGHLDLDDLGNERRWSGRKAYGDAKLANVLFTAELQRRYGPSGLSAVAFHPGVVATNFAATGGRLWRWAYHSVLTRFVTVGPDEGAARLVFLATGTPGVTWRGGAYYEKDQVARTHPQADDAELARGLWEASAELVAPFAR